MTKIMSYQDFVKITFFYYFVNGFLSSFWGLFAISEETKSGNFNLYLLYPRDPILIYVLSSFYIPITEIIACLILLSMIKFKISLIEFLLLVFSACYLLIFLIFVTFLFLNFESKTGRRIYSIFWEIGQYPTFIYKEKARILFNFVIPVVFVATFPILLKFFKRLFIIVFYFAILTAPILFLLSYLFLKRFMKNYQAYGG